MWHYQDRIIETVPEDTKAFVYLITNKISGRGYIGKKSFHSKRTLPPLKGKKRKRKVIKESDWKDYFGSCKPLLEDIERLGKENFHREMISLHETKGQADQREVEVQIKLDVLRAVDENGNRQFYNGNILSRWFVPTEESLEKMKVIQGTDKYREKQRLIKLAHWASMSEEDKKADSEKQIAGQLKSILVIMEDGKHKNYMGVIKAEKDLKIGRATFYKILRGEKTRRKDIASIIYQE